MGLKAKLIEKISPIKTEMTEGELFICEYLNDKGITFETQVKIENLKGDSKSYRVADFYLPKYKVYVEYLGQWNKHEEANIRYKEKKQVYITNNIPCVYLYPENLGIIDYVLNNRIKIELKKYKLTIELFKYRIHRLLDDRGDLFFWLFLSVLVLCIADYEVSPEVNLEFILFFASIILFQTYRLIRGYRKYFLDD